MIKNWLKRKVYSWYKRGEIFSDLFPPSEQVAIINALWRRSKDDTDKNTPQEQANERIKVDCARIAKELNSFAS